MNHIKNKIKYICDFIFNKEITLEFLLEIGTNLEPEVLAEVVNALKKQGKSPQNLNELISQADFPVFDVVGTGGIGSNKLNTSSLVSLFAGNFGLQIVKHGGRSSAGKTGAVDFIEKFGISLETVFLNAAEYFRATGVVFLSAGYTYPIYPQSAPIRKKVNGPTLFNLLGPLLNPIQVQAKLIGAFNQEIAFTLAKTCNLLAQNAVIVSAKDKDGYLDEASPFAKTFLYFCKDKMIYPFELEQIEEFSESRTSLFSDGVTVAKDLLSLKNSAATDFSKKMIAYNLALLLILNEFNSAINDDLNNLLNDIPKNIRQYYNIILSNFDEHVHLVNKRIENLCQIESIHKKSPILINNKLLLNNLTCKNEIESFFTKENLFIAEVKLARPNQNFSANLSLEKRIEAYKNADAISVVTHPSFSGSIELLQNIRKLTNKPILAKDFIRSEEEILTLVHAGANGILLLQDMLTNQELNQLVTYCKKLNVASFVESSFHIPKLGDFHVLNSRSLFSLEENKHYRNFILNFSKNKFDPKKIIIASSIEDTFQIKQCLSSFKGCIVGSTLMKMNETNTIQNFIEKSIQIQTIVKFCGARSLSDLQNAFELKVDLVGINLIPSSKRFIGKSNLEKLLPYIELIQDKFCFITRDDICLECLKMVSHLNCYEQFYSFPMLPNRRGRIAANSLKFLGTDFYILEGKKPGSGIPEKYSKNMDCFSVPVMASGGIDANNMQSRLNESKMNGWNTVGIDCASGVCCQEISKQDAAFSFEKMLSLISMIRG